MGEQSIWDRCLDIAIEVRDGFLSEEYAFPQPIGSIQERFACNQVIEAIRAAQIAALAEPPISDGWTERGKQWLAAGAPLHDEDWFLIEAQDDEQPFTVTPPEFQATHHHRDRESAETMAGDWYAELVAVASCEGTA